MAYLSYDRAPSGDASKSHLAWSRLTVLSACAAFWIVAAFVIRAIV